MTLKAYMGYSSVHGPREAAILIFARTYREAKKVGWPIASGIIVDEWINWRVNKLDQEPHVLCQMRSDTPHVVDDPISCPRCGQWGIEMLTDELESVICCVDCDPRDFLTMTGAEAGKFRLLRRSEAELLQQSGRGDRLIECGSNVVVLNSNEVPRKVWVQSISEKYVRVRNIDDVPYFPVRPKELVTIKGCFFHVICATKHELILEGAPPSPVPTEEG